VRNLAQRDFHDLDNALSGGPSLPAVVSFDIEWEASKDKRRFHYEPETWDANMNITTAQASWVGETTAARYVADPVWTSFSLFAEAGHERSGVFFPSA
jgi:hypothetical protein